MNNDEMVIDLKNALRVAESAIKMWQAERVRVIAGLKALGVEIEAGSTSANLEEKAARWRSASFKGF